MKTPDLLELAARNLRESILRNSLTTLGIGVGVASLVAMLSLGVGLQQLATKRLERTGLFDTVMVSRRDFGGFGARGRTAATSDNIRALDETARQEIAKLPGVLEAVPDLRMMTQMRFNDKPHSTLVAALPMSARDREAFENIQGKFFSSGTAAEAIVQRHFAEELLGLAPGADEAANTSGPSPELQPLLGKELVMYYAERVPATNPANGKPGGQSSSPRLPENSKPTAGPAQAGGMNAGADALLTSFSVVPHTRALRIVGIIADDPDTLRGMGRARAFVPLDFAQGLQIMMPSDLRDGEGLGGRTYTQLSVRVQNSRDVPRVEDAIHRMGLGAFSLLDASRNLQRFFTVLDLFLGIFGSLALAVASLGIINTLVMAILERRREIGILKALGASDSDVKMLFFAEAGAMGIVGGLLGVGLGWMIGKVINTATNIYLHRQNLPSETFWSVPWWLVLGALGFSLVVSLLSGLYPAARAARLDPVKALRYE
ncbi:MAG: FtsX-like permease family protein [Acidobacteriota bacterium]|nr:FtsX-like permease family protein [Acidobacteriota bacterium]